MTRERDERILLTAGQGAATPSADTAGPRADAGGPADGRA